eukprot:1351502-Rhodomonas_salina.2
MDRRSVSPESALFASRKKSCSCMLACALSDQQVSAVFVDKKLCVQSRPRWRTNLLSVLLPA